MPKHRRIFALLIVFVGIPVAYIGISIFGTDIICLTDGNHIEAEKTWWIDNTVYYIVDGRMDLVSGLRVEKVMDGGFSPASIPDRLRHHFLRSPANALGLISWMLIGAFLSALYIVATGARKHRRSQALAPEGEAGDNISTFPGSEHLKFDFGLDIVQFFLAVFRYQIGAAEDAPAHITSDEKEPSGRNYTYKLHVRQEGRWHSRRMSLGPIGEESRSKSKCYYVIYDTHMVIKVPPKALLDFEEYIANINAEKRIADKIAPRQCLIPRISSILRLVYQFANESEMSDEQLDRNYLSLLETRPALKRFLKISGSHVYFMEVARHYFLGPIVGAMHDNPTSVYNEVMRNRDIFWHPHEFYGRYGTDADPVRQQVIALHETFQQRLAGVEAPHYLKPEDLQERGLIWLLQMMAGKPVAKMAGDLPYAFRRELFRLIEEISAEKSPVIQAYRSVVTDYVSQVALNRNLPKMVSIITNLLDLLVWLGEKGVAIRDLKPDNLLVVGDPDKYPYFLNSAEDYTIGLIDLETAVDFQPAVYMPLSQPVLGGTLYYATPTHFLPNRVLESRFEDIRRIFYLQDWFAAIAIIYELIAGEYLFRMTARRLNQALKTAKADDGGKAGLTALFRHAKREFWSSAATELHSRCRQRSEPLKRVSLRLPADFHQWLVYELEATAGALRKRIKKRLKKQPVLRADGKPDSISDLSIPSLQKQLQQAKKRGRTTHLSEKQRKQAVFFFEDLIECRHAEASSARYLRDLADPAVEISAGRVIEMMFTVVQYGMRPE
jgi:serine/threonine protein kinase